jgi:putative ABC transport system ATP-binding protein
MDDKRTEPAVLQTSGLAVGRRSGFVAKLPDIALRPGESTAIVGPSGAGKTTILMAMAGIRPPQSGSLSVDGCDLWIMARSDRDRFRGRHIGLVFQSFHLIDAISVAANIGLAAGCAGLNGDTVRLNELTERLGLSGVMSARADRISHGQAQRVAIARALFNRPSVILADEPTSALDDANTETLLQLLTDAATAEGAALVVTTHDKRVLEKIKTVVRLEVAE